MWKYKLGDHVVPALPFIMDAVSIVVCMNCTFPSELIVPVHCIHNKNGTLEQTHGNNKQTFNEWNSKSKLIKSNLKVFNRHSTKEFCMNFTNIVQIKTMLSSLLCKFTKFRLVKMDGNMNEWQWWPNEFTKSTLNMFN